MGKSTSTVTPLATHHHEAGGLDQTLEFLKRTLSSIEAIVLAGEWTAQEKIAMKCTGGRRIKMKLVKDEHR